MNVASGLGPLQQLGHIDLILATPETEIDIIEVPDILDD
jgi:hypothetical protein